MTVAVSPHYEYPADGEWRFGGAGEQLIQALHMFERSGPLTVDDLPGSGADFLEQLKQFILVGPAIIASPHKIWGPQTNDLAGRRRTGALPARCPRLSHRAADRRPRVRIMCPPLNTSGIPAHGVRRGEIPDVTPRPVRRNKFNWSKRVWVSRRHPIPGSRSRRRFRPQRPDEEQDIVSDTPTCQTARDGRPRSGARLVRPDDGHLAVTTGPFALSAWAGHGLTGGMDIVAFIAPPACLIRIAVRRTPVAAGDDRAAGRVRPTDGLAVAPTIAYCGSRDPRALWGRRRRCSLRGSARPDAPPGAT